jgi:hypothetical protein
MYDWTDDFCWQACMSYPNLRYFIMQAVDEGHIDNVLNLLMAMEYEGRRDV